MGSALSSAGESGEMVIITLLEIKNIFGGYTIALVLNSLLFLFFVVNHEVGLLQHCLIVFVSSTVTFNFSISNLSFASVGKLWIGVSFTDK